jgi:hypothetical protein
MYASRSLVSRALSDRLHTIIDGHRASSSQSADTAHKIA